MLRVVGILITAMAVCSDFAVAQSHRLIGPLEFAPFELSLPRLADAVIDEPDRYAELAKRHKLDGRACYYSGFFEGRKTASGETFRHKRFTAAHLTLPLGTWLEVESVQTGKKIRVKVNDRGPYSGGFVLDLSQSAARALGVDRARDRRVKTRILALPGEKPPSEVVNPDTPSEVPSTTAEASPRQ